MGQIRYIAIARASAPTLMAALATALGLASLAGCGGGGGGAPPANVIGRVMLVSSGQALNGATVTIGGTSYVTGSNAVGVGNFVLNNVSSTSTQIMITGTGLKPLTQTLSTLIPNQTNDLGDIFVLDTTSDPLADYKATVTGAVVRNDTFAPISGATVKFSGQSMVTGAAGTFQFTNLPSGLGQGTNGQDLVVGLIKASGFEDKEIRLGGLALGASPPVNPLGDIPMFLPVGPTPTPPANIKGKVSITAQTIFSGTTVTLVKKSDGSTVSSQITKADGLYGFYVVAGTYTVKVSHTGFANQQADVTLPRPDQVQVKDFTLAP